MTTYRDYELFMLAEMGLLERVETLIEECESRECSINDYTELVDSFVWNSTFEGYEYWAGVEDVISEEYWILAN